VPNAVYPDPPSRRCPVPSSRALFFPASLRVWCRNSLTIRRGLARAGVKKPYFTPDAYRSERRRERQHHEWSSYTQTPLSVWAALNGPRMSPARLITHRANLHRYESLLTGDLTAYERRYLEDMAERERQTLAWLTAGGCSINSGRPQSGVNNPAE
jgi:hypothetical protein